jgi:DNA-binding Xre family transcriptional regulator
MKYLKKIKTEAAKRNIPLKQLANSIHVSEEGLKKALRNDSLSVQQLNKICGELSIDVGDLFLLKNTTDRKMDRNLHFLSNKVFC